MSRFQLSSNLSVIIIVQFLEHLVKLGNEKLMENRKRIDQ